MKRNRMLFVVLALSLAGCSDLATKDAPIEDRSGASKGVSTLSAEAKDKATASGAKTSEVTTAVGSAAPATSAVTVSPSPSGATQTEAGVQTQGATLQGVEVRPLPSTTEGGQVATGTSGGVTLAESATTGPARFANMSTPPKDVDSPLAKRIIYFDYDSSVIKDEYRDLIQAHAEFLTASKEGKAVLQGHTDERGSRDYNLALGQRRAESVQQAFTLLGVDPKKIEAVSFGEEKPTNESHDEAAWSQNRRVEINYLGE